MNEPNGNVGRKELTISIPPLTIHDPLQLKPIVTRHGETGSPIVQGVGERRMRRPGSPVHGHQRRNSMSILHDATTGKVIPHMRRPRPNLQVSWIQDRHKELRNTWNSRMG